MSLSVSVGFGLMWKIGVLQINIFPRHNMKIFHLRARKSLVLIFLVVFFFSKQLTAPTFSMTLSQKSIKNSFNIWQTSPIYKELSVQHTAGRESWKTSKRTVRAGFHPKRNFSSYRWCKGIHEIQGIPCFPCCCGWLECGGKRENNNICKGQWIYFNILIYLDGIPKKYQLILLDIEFLTIITQLIFPFLRIFFKWVKNIFHSVFPTWIFFK